MEVRPQFKEKFSGLTISGATRTIIENVKINLYRQGERLFLKKELPDYAYLILFGDLSFYDTRPVEEKNEPSILITKNSKIDITTVDDDK